MKTVQRIPLETMSLEVHSPRVSTILESVSVLGTAKVKVNASTTEMLEYAAEQLGGKSGGEIVRICLETIERHQNVVVGNMTAEDIYRDIMDRDQVYKDISQKVMEGASVDLNNMGISIISYVLKAIGDEVNISSNIRVLKLIKYFQVGDPGQTRTAQVKNKKGPRLPRFRIASRFRNFR